MDDQQIEDLSRGAFEEAMAFGVNFDVFHRMAKAVATKQREALAQMLDEKANEWDDPAEAFGLRLGATEIRARANT